MWDHVGVGRMEPDRRIKVQKLAKPRRRRDELRFYLLDIRFAALQLGGSTVGVCVAALTGLGIVGSQPGDRPGFLACLKGHGVPALGPEQLAVGQSHLKENLIADCDVFELTLPHELPALQVTEDSHRRVAAQEDARNVHRAGGHCHAACTQVNGAPVDRQDIAVGLLEVAGMSVVVHARIDRGEKPGRGELPQGHGLQHSLAGQVQLGILHSSQPQRRIQVDRLNLGTQDGGRGYRNGKGDGRPGLTLLAGALPLLLRRQGLGNPLPAGSVRRPGRLGQDTSLHRHHGQRRGDRERRNDLPDPFHGGLPAATRPEGHPTLPAILDRLEKMADLTTTRGAENNLAESTGSATAHVAVVPPGRNLDAPPPSPALAQTDHDRPFCGWPAERSKSLRRIHDLLLGGIGVCR